MSGEPRVTSPGPRDIGTSRGMEGASLEPRLPRQRTAFGAAEDRLFRAVAEVNDAIRAGADRGTVLGLIARNVRQLVGASMSLVMELETAEQFLICAVDGDAERGLSGRRVDAVRTVEGDVARRQRPRVVRESSDGSAGPVTRLSVPVPGHGRASGLIQVAGPEGRVFTTTDAQIVELFTASAAMEIGHDRLVTAARERAAFEERQRLARELHDSASQALYGIALGARTARYALRESGEAPLELVRRVDTPLSYVLSLAESGLADMRALIFELQPQALAEQGLVTALHKQLAALRARQEITIEAELGDEPAMSLPVKQTLYRVAQEALQNVARHSRASRLAIRLMRRAATVDLVIEDNGVGFDPTGSFPGHLGLRSMHDRMAEVGGRLELVSTPGQGTRISATAPLGDSKPQSTSQGGQ